jgi:hypothetical protein
MFKLWKHPPYFAIDESTLGCINSMLVQASSMPHKRFRQDNMPWKSGDFNRPANSSSEVANWISRLPRLKWTNVETRA